MFSISENTCKNLGDNAVEFVTLFQASMELEAFRYINVQAGLYLAGKCTGASASEPNP